MGVCRAIVQYNNAGAFAGSANFTFDGTSTINLFNGVLSGLILPASLNDAANKQYVDSLVLSPGTALSQSLNVLNVNVDTSNITTSSNQLTLADTAVTPGS